VFDDIYRAPLAHREMVRRVEGLGGDVAPDASWRGKESRVERPESRVEKGIAPIRLRAARLRREKGR
jgi:hypothetical protein